MILIISNENDSSTGTVINYLNVNGYSCLRLTERQFISSLKIVISTAKTSLVFKVGEQEYTYEEITAFWFRKNKIEFFKDLELSFPDDYSAEHKAHLRKFLFEEELKSVHEFLFFLLEKKHFLGNFNVGNANKMVSFECARESGLAIPTSLISTELNDLREFSLNSGPLIAKPIEEGYFFPGQDYFFYSKNTLFETKAFEANNDSLFPSCLQEYIEKKFELRIFYLNGKCYSMAIFSQADERTRIDFRNYNDDTPNRMVPYNLPEEVEKNITTFMEKMKLRSGSIDMVLTLDNQYVFLEVNPVGQYGMVAVNCNYPLDKLIFNDLIAS